MKGCPQACPIHDVDDDAVKTAPTKSSEEPIKELDSAPRYGGKHVPGGLAMLYVKFLAMKRGRAIPHNITFICFVCIGAFHLKVAQTTDRPCQRLLLEHDLSEFYLVYGRDKVSRSTLGMKILIMKPVYEQAPSTD